MEDRGTEETTGSVVMAAILYLCIPKYGMQSRLPHSIDISIVEGIQNPLSYAQMVIEPVKVIDLWL